MSAIATAALTLPLAPVGSRWFNVIVSLNDTYMEQFGWEELPPTPRTSATCFPKTSGQHSASSREITARRARSSITGGSTASQNHVRHKLVLRSRL